MEFLGSLVLMVYVGAIAMLFLFVIMLVSLPVNSGITSRFNLHFLMLGILCFLESLLVFSLPEKAFLQESWTIQLLDLGNALYSLNFFFYVLLIGLLLLAIIIGVLALAVPTTIQGEVGHSNIKTTRAKDLWV